MRRRHGKAEAAGAEIAKLEAGEAAWARLKGSDSVETGKIAPAKRHSLEDATAS